MDLNESARRSVIREVPSQNKISEEINQSQFIKDRLRESRIEEQVNNSLSRRSIS